MRAISSIFPQFFDLDGSPLDGGYLYIGKPDLNPEAYPIPVFSDAEGTQPLANPVRTIAGYPDRYGAPTGIYTDSAYSLTVKNHQGYTVYNVPNSAKESGDSASIIDAGAVNNGTGDNSGLFNDLFNKEDSEYFLPAGVYNIDSMIILDCKNVSIRGVAGATFIQSSTLAELVQIVDIENVHISGITFLSSKSSALSSAGVVFGTDCNIKDSSVKNCTFSAPSCKSGGIVINGASIVDNLDVHENIAQSVGGRGFSISGASWRSTYENNVVNGSGLSADVDGDAFYFGGTGVAPVINGNTANSYRGSPFKFEGLINLRATSNASASVADSFVSIKDCQLSQLSDNDWRVSGAVEIDGSTSTKVTNDMIVSGSTNAVILKNGANNTEWVNGYISNAAATDSAANRLILADGAATTSNRFTCVEIRKTSLGALRGATNGAALPNLFACTGDATGGDDGSVISWTPTTDLDATGATYTAWGRLTKEGAIVHAEFKLVFSNRGTEPVLPALPDLRIFGLPFNSLSGSGGGAGCGVLQYLYCTGVSRTPQLEMSGNSIRILMGNNNDALNAPFGWSNLTNTSVISGTVTYLTNE